MESSSGRKRIRVSDTDMEQGQSQGQPSSELYSDTDKVSNRLRQILRKELYDCRSNLIEEAEQNSGMIPKDMVLTKINDLLEILSKDDAQLLDLDTHEDLEDPILKLWFENSRVADTPETHRFERDVDIVCKGGSVIPVHSAVLVAASPLFREHFKNGCMGNHTVVHLPDYNRDEISQILELLYTGRSLIKRCLFDVVWDLLTFLQIANNPQIHFSSPTAEDLQLNQESFANKYLSMKNIKLKKNNMSSSSTPCQLLQSPATTMSVQSPASASTAEEEEEIELEDYSENENDATSSSSSSTFDTDESPNVVDYSSDLLIKPEDEVHSETDEPEHEKIETLFVVVDESPAIQIKSFFKSLLIQKPTNDQDDDDDDEMMDCKVIFDSSINSGRNLSSASSSRSMQTRTRNPLINAAHLTNILPKKVFKKKENKNSPPMTINCSFTNYHQRWEITKEDNEGFFPAKTLADLTTLLNASLKINPNSNPRPMLCTNFCFDEVENLDSPDAQEFLNLHGHLITKLKLNLAKSNSDSGSQSDSCLNPKLSKVDPNLDPNAVKKLLTVQAPNVEFLDLVLPTEVSNLALRRFGLVLASTKKGATASFVSSNSVTPLPHLKTLKMELGIYHKVFDSLLEEILTSAVNLKTYINDNLGSDAMASDYLKAFSKSDRIQAVTSFYVGSSYYSNLMDHLEPFKSSMADNQLECLGMDMTVHSFEDTLKERVVSLINTLLEKNTKSLKMLSFYGSVAADTLKCSIKFPKLPNLRVLRLVIDRDKMFIVPPGLQITQFAPSLHTVLIDLSSDSFDVLQDPWKQSCPHLEPVTTVKTIVVRCSGIWCPAEYLRSLAPTFPNVDKLIVQNLNACHVNAGPAIWESYPNLKSLELCFNIVPSEEEETSTFYDVSSELDSFFTGFAADSRRRSSIASLKKLTELIISFEGEFTSSQPGFPHLLSPVSKRLFDLMRSLYVEFRLDKLKTDNDERMKEIKASLSACGTVAVDGDLYSHETLVEYLMSL